MLGLLQSPACPGLHPSLGVRSAEGGRYSLGICKLCGERRKGVNSISTEYSMPVGKAVTREPGGEEVKAGRLKYYANAKQKVMR